MLEELIRRSLKNLQPVDINYGKERGTPIDRYYIEKFLNLNKNYIKGVVLEVKDNEYTRKFGSQKVEVSDVIDINKLNLKANICEDLRNLKKIPYNHYDCIILTQTIHIIDDYDAVLKNINKILKPEGVLLCTIPFISKMDSPNDCWRFTKTSAKYVFQKHFPNNKIIINSYGNILVGLGFYIGAALEEIPAEKLDAYDPIFPLITCIKAIK